MSFIHRARYVNPRLGLYFGIFMSAFVALGLLSLILEGLGIAPVNLSVLMLVGPVLLYAGIGIAAYTQEPLDYFAAGRRVPAFYSGLVLSQTALGGTGLVVLTGAFFFIGFDVLCLAIGGVAGFVFMAVLLAPFFRKFGAFTVPSYLGRRYDSKAVRLVASAALVVPLILMLAAEVRVGSYALAWLWGQESAGITALLVTILMLTLVAGGMRSLTWSTVAESIASLIALMVPVVFVALIVTSLPIPQLSAGPVLRALSRAEAAQGLPIIIPPTLAFDLPAEGLSTIGKRFSDAFATVGPLAFVIMTLSTVAGVAASPWLLPRVAATPGVYEARKSLGWATLIFGVVMLTLGAIGIFMRDYLMDVVTAPGAMRIPAWLNDLKAYQLAAFETTGQHLELSQISINRDAVLLSLPIVAEMPTVAVYLAAAGVVAATLAGAGAVTVALGNILAEDVVHGLAWEPPSDGLRLVVARATLALAAAAGGVVALAAPTDPLKLMLWALALTASSLFPVLVLSVWWKRSNAFGAIAGMTAGLAVAVIAMLAGEAEVIGLASPLAAALGMPAAFGATIAVTVLTPSPGRHVLELVRDIRVPGGEIIYDRETRLLRRQRR